MRLHPCRDCRRKPTAWCDVLRVTGAIAVTGGGADEVWCHDRVVVGAAAAAELQQAGTPVESLDVRGCVVTPGLVNAHHHLLQTAFRTLRGTRGVPMSTWLPTMAAAYGRVGVDPELAYAAAVAGIAESLLSG